jgi:hypothetical protein
VSYPGWQGGNPDPTSPGIRGGLAPRRPDQRYRPPATGAAPGTQSNVGRFKIVIISASGGLFLYSGTPAAGNPPIGSWTTSTTDPYGNTVDDALSLSGMPILIYSGPPAHGNLITSIAPAAGTDAFGNTYVEGFGLSVGQIPGTLINAGSIPASAAGFTATSIGGITTYVQGTAPSGSINAGSLWIDTSSGNAIYQYASGTWTLYQFGPGGISSLTATLIGNIGVLNPNPYFQGGDSTGWSAFNGTFAVTATPPAGAPYTYAGVYVNNGVSSGAMEESAGTFPVQLSTQYLVTAWVYSSVTTVQLGFDWQSSTHGYVSTSTQNFTVTANTWTQITTVQTSPASGVAYGYARLGDASADSATIYGQAITVLPQVPGTLVQAGTITATQIAAGTITAVQIAANTITSANIAADAITAGLIAAGAIDGFTINGVTINGNTINAADVLISGTNGGLFSYGSIAPQIRGTAVNTFKNFLGAQTSVSFTVQNPTYSGDAILVSIFTTPLVSAIGSVTDGAGNTYTSIQSEALAGTGTVWQFIALNTTGLTTAKTLTVNLTSSGAFVINVIAEDCIGVATTSAVDKTATGNGATPQSLSTGTLSQAPELAVGAWASFTSLPMLDDSVFVNSSVANPGGTFATYAAYLNATGTVTNTVDTTSGSIAGCLVTLKGPATTQKLVAAIAGAVTTDPVLSDAVGPGLNLYEQSATPGAVTGAALLYGSTAGQPAYVNPQGLVMNMTGGIKATLATVTATTGLVASATVPASDAVAGAVYRITAWGTVTVGNPSEIMTWGVKLGSVVLGTGTTAGANGPTAAAFAASATLSWRMQADVQCLTTGSSGTWTGGLMGVITVTANNIIVGTAADNSIPIATGSASGQTISTTSSNTLGIQFSSTGAQSATATGGYMERVI